MSWHYSQALVAAYSEATCSDGAQSAPSNTSPTPQVYLSPDRMTAFSRLSRFGMTCEPLTESLGAELLTWFRAAFPVRTYPAQERAQELTGNDQGSGAKWPGSLARYDHASRSWRTVQYSLLGGSVEFSETWPRWGTMRSGACWERMTLGRPTGGIESGYSLPTPTCMDHSGTGRMNKNANVKKWGGINSLGGMASTGMWPTPCATDHKGSGKTGDLRDRLDYAVERGATKSAVYATPQSRDFRTGQQERYENPNRTKNLNDQIGGQLNPTWVEKLMAWPEGWTCLYPISRAKILSWKMGFLDDDEKRKAEVLRMLRSGDVAQEIRDALGRPIGIYEAAVLLSELCEHSNRPDEARVLMACSQALEKELRGLRPQESATGTPHRSGQYEQHAREHTDTMQKLSRLLAHYGEAYWSDGRWEDATPRVATGIPARVDRLKAIGNGQVPAVAAAAFMQLIAAQRGEVDG